MSNDIRAYVLEALAAMNYDVSAIDDSTPLGPLGLDLESLALAELAIQVEDRFQVRIEEDETEQFALMTLGELVVEITRRAALAQTGGRSE
ncbi:acyl carrier protein [Streptomyces sp. NPDC047000]|uniref:acyl carrier protein n=1 Tax=Streptomyces sp. NPDC047000 TaxID=3155474 RepID=UPI0033D6BC6E